MAPAPSARPPKVKEQRKNNTTSFPYTFFCFALQLLQKKGSSVGEEKKRNDGNISRAFLFESLFSLASNCLPNIANRCASIKEPDLHSIVVGLTRATLAGGVEESELAVHCLQFRRNFFSPLALLPRNNSRLGMKRRAPTHSRSVIGVRRSFRVRGSDILCVYAARTKKKVS